MVRGKRSIFQLSPLHLFFFAPDPTPLNMSSKKRPTYPFRRLFEEQGKVLTVLLSLLSQSYTTLPATYQSVCVYLLIRMHLRVSPTAFSFSACSVVVARSGILQFFPRDLLLLSNMVAIVESHSGESVDTLRRELISLPQSNEEKVLQCRWASDKRRGEGREKRRTKWRMRQKRSPMTV